MSRSWRGHVGGGPWSPRRTSGGDWACDSAVTSRKPFELEEHNDCEERQRKYEDRFRHHDPPHRSVAEKHSHCNHSDRYPHMISPGAECALDPTRSAGSLSIEDNAEDIAVTEEMKRSI